MTNPFRRFCGSRRGNVALIFALSIIPFLVIAGFAVDIGRAILVRERMAHALDAAILAVGAAPQLTNEEAQELGAEFFHANFDQTAMASSYDVNVTVDNDTVRMSARAEVPTTLLALLNHESISLYQQAEAVRGGLDLELAMVLDNTGSMSGSKIEALRSAATDAVDIIFDAAGSEPDAVKIGLVPFASTVNVGSEYARASWLDPDAQSPAHHDSHTWNADINRWDLFDAVQVPWRGCVEARAEPYDLDDTPPSSGNPSTLFTPYFAADAPGDRGQGWNWNYSGSESWLDDGEWPRAINPDNGGLISWLYGQLSWSLRNLLGDGLSSTLGLGEGDYYDSEEAARQAYVGKYYESHDVYGDGPNAGCINRPIFPLTIDKDALDTQIDAMQAGGNTNIPNGMAWGIRVLSPTAPFTEGRPFDTDKLVKAIIVLTDGDNVMSGANNYNKSRYNTYGYIAEDRFGIQTSNSNTLGDRLDDKMTQVCSYAKSLGIRVYSITFQVSSQDTQDLMEDCASNDRSGSPLYWNSPSTEELQQAFRDIARDLVDLRLTK